MHFFLLARPELQWNASQVQMGTTSLWLMYIERLMSFRRRDQISVKRNMKKVSGNGARTISLIVAPWSMLVTFTGWLFIFLVQLYTCFCQSHTRLVATLYTMYPCSWCSSYKFAPLNFIAVFLQPNPRKCWTNGSSCSFLWGWHASVSKMSCCLFLPQCSIKAARGNIQVLNFDLNFFLRGSLG